MYNHYPDQTKRNVVARRAGITFSTLSKALNISKSTIDTCNKSKRYINVEPSTLSYWKKAMRANSGTY